MQSEIPILKDWPDKYFVVSESGHASPLLFDAADRAAGGKLLNADDGATFASHGAAADASHASAVLFGSVDHSFRACEVAVEIDEVRLAPHITACAPQDP
eukprot:11517515-Karenia_brevis.AAC.1